MGLPGPVDLAPVVSDEGLAVDLVDVFPDDNRVPAVLPVDHYLHPLRAGLGVLDLRELLGLAELEPVGLGMVVDDSAPAVDADHRNDAVLLVGEREYLSRERVEPILIGDD